LTGTGSPVKSFFPKHFTKRSEQADITGEMVETVLESGVYQYFAFWRFNDQNRCWGPNVRSELWDKDNNAKPNYYAVQRVLDEYAGNLNGKPVFDRR
jgi:hypothetical protein